MFSGSVQLGHRDPFLFYFKVSTFLRIITITPFNWNDGKYKCVQQLVGWMVISQDLTRVGTSDNACARHAERA